MTHLAVWMANYLTGAWREPTAVLEWNDHGDFEKMERFFLAGAHRPQQKRAGIGKMGRSGQSAPDFQILEVDYYGRADAGVLADCLGRDYRHIIVDFGENSAARLSECARCDRKILVGGLSEWQAEAFLELAAAEPKRDESWIYTAAFGSEETRKEWEKAFRITCLRIPSSVDAFAVTSGAMKFFDQLLC